jgi:voltage-gated sodium channel
LGFSLTAAMNEIELMNALEKQQAPLWRRKLAAWIEQPAIQNFVIAVIVVNAAILGMETDAQLMAAHGTWLKLADKICLSVFIFELVIKLLAYRGLFWRNSWNLFDFVVVAIALVPNAGPWAVLRSMRVLRVLRLLTVVPQLRKVVAAFLHSIPGLSGVIAIMAIFFFTAGVLATNLFGPTFPQWFGSLGASLYSLFQIMTLESWSMGIVRPLMEVHGWAWAFFVPFIVIATFTILNLFIGIIVSTMQELSSIDDKAPKPLQPDPATTSAIIARIEADLAALRKTLEQ